MTASSLPKEMRMTGYMIGGEVYVKEADARKHIQTAFAANGNSTLLAALRSIIDAWDAGPASATESKLANAINVARKTIAHYLMRDRRDENG